MSLILFNRIFVYLKFNTKFCVGNQKSHQSRLLTKRKFKCPTTFDKQIPSINHRGIALSKTILIENISTHNWDICFPLHFKMKYFLFSLLVLATLSFALAKNQCGENEIFNDCGSPCDRTCENPNPVRFKHFFIMIGGG